VLERNSGTFLQGKDTDPAIKKQMREATSNEQSCSVEGVNDHKCSQPYWMRSNSQPLFENDKLTGVMALPTDISKQKQADISLRRLNNMQTAIVDSAKLIIISCHVHGKILTCNKRRSYCFAIPIIEQFHVTEEHMCFANNQGKLASKVLAPGFESLFYRTSLGKTDNNDWHYVTQPGQEIPEQLTVATLISTDKH
jgi:two-component system sensor histidine kinase/response regulator